MSSDNFGDKQKKEVLKMLKKDLIFANDKKAAKELQAEKMSIGGCVGLRIRGEAKETDDKNWVLDVHAVSDGEILYLFSLRNLEENYKKNLAVYERAISSVVLTSVK